MGLESAFQIHNIRIGRILEKSRQKLHFCHNRFKAKMLNTFVPADLVSLPTIYAVKTLGEIGKNFVCNFIKTIFFN